MHSLLNFLTRGATLRALRARKLRYNYFFKKKHAVTYPYRVNTKLGPPLVKPGAGMTGFREVYIQFSKYTGIITVTLLFCIEFLL